MRDQGNDATVATIGSHRAMLLFNPKKDALRTSRWIWDGLYSQVRPQLPNHQATH